MTYYDLIRQCLLAEAERLCRALPPVGAIIEKVGNKGNSPVGPGAPFPKSGGP